MRETLRFEMNQMCLQTAFSELEKSLENRINFGNNELQITNAIWMQKDFNVLSTFQKVIVDSYGDCLFELNFTDTESARVTINDWIEDKTNRRINELIKQSSLHPATRMILTNTLYFLGKWKYLY